MLKYISKGTVMLCLSLLSVSSQESQSEQALLGAKQVSATKKMTMSKGKCIFSPKDEQAKVQDRLE